MPSALLRRCCSRCANGAKMCVPLWARSGKFPVTFTPFVMCMVQTGKVTNYPIVLMGTEYWSGLLEWMDNTLAASGYINEGYRELFLLTNDPDEALSHIIQRHQVMSDKRIREPR